MRIKKETEKGRRCAVVVVEKKIFWVEKGKCWNFSLAFPFCMNADMFGSENRNEGKKVELLNVRILFVRVGGN